MWAAFLLGSGFRRPRYFKQKHAGAPKSEFRIPPMPRFAFLAFAIVCLLQRLVEIARNDRNVQQRRPKWTAIAISLVFLGFSVSSVVEAFVPGHTFHLLSAIAGAALFATGFLIRRWVL